MSERRTAEQPEDALNGSDPTISTRYERVEAWRAVCDCGWAWVAMQSEAEQRISEHRRWAHPAYRNPDIACQASPPWDHKRWCVRPKDHDGDHWTPSLNGGVGWTNREQTR